jgi:hypothetical protein
LAILCSNPEATKAAIGGMMVKILSTLVRALLAHPYRQTDQRITEDAESKCRDKRQLLALAVVNATRPTRRC